MSEPTPTPVDPKSAAQVVEDQAQSLRDAMETAKHWLTANTQLDASMRFVRAYSILNQALEGRLGDLDQLAKELRESAPPEPAGRPLEAIFADIRAEGHENIHLRRHGGTWWLSTAIETELRPNESNLDHLHRTENKLAWSDADDPGPLAEARLAEIRELHAAAAPPPEIQAVLAGLHPVTEEQARAAFQRFTREGWQGLPGPEEVDSEHEALAAEDAARELAASEEGQE